MTKQQAFEKIKRLFPDAKAPYIMAELNHSQNKFARETHILRKVGTLTNMTTQVSWSLPSDVVQIYEIELYDTNGKALSKVDKSIDWFIDDNTLVFFDTSTTKKITSIPTAISNIWVRYSHLPTALTSADSDVAASFEVGDQFSDGVIAGALEAMFSSNRIPLGVDREGNAILGMDIRSAGYWGDKYIECRKDAKRWINSIDSTERQAQNYQHAGFYELPKEAKDANISTEDWS